MTQGGRKRCITVELLRGTKTKREAQRRRKRRGREEKRKKGGEEEQKRRKGEEAQERGRTKVREKGWKAGREEKVGFSLAKSAVAL